MFKKLVEGVVLKDSLDRIATAMERVATALEQHLPPVEPEEVKKLEESDYRPASDIHSYEQQIFDLIAEREGPMDAAKEQRVREFIRSQYNL